jgi:PhzF family phenazine biosynthesis protein
MPQKIVQIDAFTDRAFAGNPAAVCLLEEGADEGWMQAVAREMNLSETAFLHPEAEGYRLRWFTPVAEVELCGHATVASAHFLWEGGHLDAAAEAVFFTRSGRLAARRAGDWIEVDFPADRPVEGASALEPAALAEALGAPVVSARTTGLYLLVEVADESTLRSLEPEFHLVRRLHPVGISVTAPGDTDGVDFVSRFFAPAVGIDEDPVTGSAHCSLGPFWGDRLGKQELLAHQISPRGGVVRVRLAGDRVVLGGQAVTVLHGELIEGP